MLEKESGNDEESPVSILNSENVVTNVATREGDRSGSCGGFSLCTQMGTLNGTSGAVSTDEEIWTVPEGYRFLPEEYFPVKGVPPPLVSLSWFRLLNSDEESVEDSIPLAKLRNIIKKKRKVRKTPPSKSPAQEGKPKKDRKKQEVEDHINRKRGRPKKESVEIAAPENEIENKVDDFFWSNESNSSHIDAQDEGGCQTDNMTEDENTFSANHNEHDYFKPIENTVEEFKVSDKKEKQKKRKAVVQGVKTEDSKISFPCFECGKSFSAASTLKSHQRIHNGTLLICPECHKGFVSKYLLKCHMRIHNGDLFMCHKCGRGFTTAELLKVHSRAHTGDRPFVCNICGKSFPTSSNMLQHKQIHNSEKKFLCSQCGSSFVQKRCLDYHMLAHSEKKNICNVCGKLWARKSDLIEHMRVHTGVKPYCCTICPQKFSQASSLKRHQLVHLDVKPISCATCNKMFKCQEYYKRHLRKHEKEDYLFSDI